MFKLIKILLCLSDVWFCNCIIFILSFFIFLHSCADVQKYPFAAVRLPPDETDLTPPVFEEGMEVEVFTRSTERESCGWWIASIKMMKAEFCAVAYIGFETPYTEICELKRLRLKNPNPPITPKSFYQFHIRVPEELRQEYVFRA